MEKNLVIVLAHYDDYEGGEKGICDFIMSSLFERISI